MKKSQNSEITIPIREMPEKDRMKTIMEVIRQFPGVSDVDVEANQIKVIYDVAFNDFFGFYQEIIDVGLDIPITIAILNIQKMSCISCIAHVEGALADIPGVLNVTVSLSKNNAKVAYLSDVVSIQNMENAVRKIGYQVANSNEKI